MIASQKDVVGINTWLSSSMTGCRMDMFSRRTDRTETPLQPAASKTHEQKSLNQQIWLVVEPNPSGKYESIGMMNFQTEWKNKIHVPKPPTRNYLESSSESSNPVVPTSWIVFLFFCDILKLDSTLSNHLIQDFGTWLSLLWRLSQSVLIILSRHLKATYTVTWFIQHDMNCFSRLGLFIQVVQPLSCSLKKWVILKFGNLETCFFTSKSSHKATG